jgi:uncharacterized protein YyaL (SSP411 family)
MKDSDNMTNLNKVPNRLAKEKSPYLLQHANNPVDWYSWSDEAFEKAKSEDKPIFLSIGYSTCHWCHVMERESFEDKEVADILNEHFIAIKVDREERPDVDHIYMSVCQLLTGRGGWPLTVFITPEAKPFFAGTYFPKRSRMGMAGLIDILTRVKEEWNNNKETLLRFSEDIISEIYNEKEEDLDSGKSSHDPLDNYSNSNDNLNGNVLNRAFSLYNDIFDNIHGGFGNAPKFPTPSNLLFLLRYWYIKKEPRALEMVKITLDSMYKGGIYDHIGFGFCRYSTDKKWLVPHFEKMLYDNALLAVVYLEVYNITSEKRYAEIAKEIFTYVLRDMTSPEGAFYSAEDADSEGVEGKFYTWSLDEIKTILGDKIGKMFSSLYNITDEGNFESKNILNLIASSNEKRNSNRWDLNDNVFEIDWIKESRSKLYRLRNKRVHPHKDDKILTSWNGLMIAAMSIGGRILKENSYTVAAKRAVDFIFAKLVQEDGRLLARFRDGNAAFPAYAEDYAFLIWGLIELYETTFNPEYLEKAINLNNELIKYFWDDQAGGLFMYGSDSEKLIVRPKEIYDGATPSGNSVSALNFLKLAKLTGQYELEERAHRLLKAFNNDIQGYPINHAFSLIAIAYANSPVKEIIIAADIKDKTVEKAISIINQKFRPFTTLLLYTGEHKDLRHIVPFAAEYKLIENKTTFYICENFVCREPITDIEQLEKLI